MPRQTSAPPPPPISMASSGVALAAADARNAAAAASGKGFGRTIKTSPQGAAKPSTASAQLTPQSPLKSLFGA
jgi:hypothetical protein